MSLQNSTAHLPVKILFYLTVINDCTIHFRYNINGLLFWKNEIREYKVDSEWPPI